MTKINHCKCSYEVIVPFSDDTLVQIILVNGVEYKLDYLPRPAKNYSDLFCVYNKGIRYNTLAKFLKFIK